MGLRNKDQEADTKVEELNKGAEATEDVSEEKKETKKPAAEKKKKKDVAPKSSETGVTTKSTAKGVFITNVDLLEIVSNAVYGDFPTISASNGNHMMKAGQKKINLGNVIEFQAISAREVWKVTPGETTDEAKKFFKVSYDGETCEDGTSVEEALEECFEAGFAKANIAEGIDIGVLVRKCEKDPEQEGEIRILSCSPSSSRNWAPLCKNVQAKAAMGILRAVPIAEGSEYSSVMFRSTVLDAVSKGGFDYNLFDFELA